MKTRRLGYSDLFITMVGLGTWAIGGGDNPYGWGQQDDKQSILTIRRAIDLGINWLDTAKGYGHGHSEEVVGEALKGYRDKVIIATKCGILWKEDGSDIYGHLKAKSIKQECESSLNRLQTDYIDLYQIHWPMPDEDLEEGWGAIADLIKEGKVRYAGGSNFSVDQIKRVQAIHPMASIQPPYSMLKRDIEADLLPYCLQNNIGVICYSPMQAGLLTGKFSRERLASLPADDWRKNNPDFNEPALSANLWLVDELRKLADSKHTSVANIAVSWVLSHEAVSGAILGARNPGQIEETVKAAEVVLTETEKDQISKLLHDHQKRQSN